MGLDGWEVVALTFNGQNAGRELDPRVQVTIFRKYREVPPGRKRAVERNELVVHGEVFSAGAWAALRPVLEAAGAKVEERVRPW